MIPSDVVSRIKLATDLSAAPTAPIDKVKDALSDLVPGQRVMAEIQALMPNGTYRAMVAQREVVLALPYSAKKGDALELEVIENDGKIAFALLAGKSQPGEQQADSVSASLSRTGQLISDLLSPPGKEGQKAAAAPLNNNLPMLAQFPATSAELVPVLKQAITQSGLFYESHQVQWAEGKLPTASLVQQPQGQLSNPNTLAQAMANPEHNPFAEALAKPLAENIEVAPLPAPNTESKPTTRELQGPANTFVPSPNDANSTRTPVAPELAPLVQQQLEALATQTYAWQGQVWPKQQMEWEISDQGGGPGDGEENDYRWQTNLRLQMPRLGEVNATLRLRGENQIDVSILTNSPDSEMQLSLGGPSLNQQMEDAGLFLAMFGVTRHDKTE